jgi:hypothetical protein
MQMESRWHRAKSIVLGVAVAIGVMFGLAIAVAMERALDQVTGDHVLERMRILQSPPDPNVPVGHPLIHALITLTIIVGGLAWALWPARSRPEAAVRDKARLTVIPVTEHARRRNGRESAE